MNEYLGKRILITGSSRGIGRACALRFAREGGEIIVNYISNLDEAKETETQIRNAGGSSKIIQGDLGKTEDVSRIWEAASSGNVIPSVLVLNAAFQKKADFDDTDEDLLEHTLRVNIVGNFNLIKHYINACRQHGIQGNIIIHSSNQSEFINPTGFAYSISKAALNHLTKHVARIAVKDQIRVNAVILGWFNTEGERIFYPEHMIIEQSKKTIPMERVGDPEEAAELTYFLASQKSSYMTGSLVRLDGGYSLNPDLNT